MLEEFIRKYEKALKSGDKKSQLKIEADLRKLGMDKRTLMLIIRERSKR